METGAECNGICRLETCSRFSRAGTTPLGQQELVDGEVCKRQLPLSNLSKSNNNNMIPGHHTLFHFV